MFKKVLLVLLAILLVVGVSTALVYLIDFRQDSNEEVVDTPEDSGSIDTDLSNDDVNQSFDVGLSLSLNYSSVNLYYNGVASDGTTLPSCITLTPNFYPSTSYFSGNVIWTSFVLDEDGEIIGADIDSPSNYLSYIDVYGTMGRTYFADKEQTGSILVICSCDGYSSSCILNIYCANDEGYVDCDEIHYTYNASMDVYTSTIYTYYVYFDTAFECSFPQEYPDGLVPYGADSGDTGSGGFATYDWDYITPLYDTPTIYNASGFIRFDFYKNDEIDVSKNSFQIWFTLTEKENHLHVHENCCATCYLNVKEYSSGSGTGGSTGGFVDDKDTGYEGSGDTGSGGLIGDPTTTLSFSSDVSIGNKTNVPIFTIDSSSSLESVSAFGFNAESILYSYEDVLYSLSLYSFDNFDGDTYSEIVYYYDTNYDCSVLLSLPISITFTYSDSVYCLNTYIDILYIS